MARLHEIVHVGYFRFKIFVLSHLFSLSHLRIAYYSSTLPTFIPTNHCNIQTFLFSLNYIQFFPCQNFQTVLISL